DMAAAFGGGSSQSAFGARAGATVLSKATTVLAVLFMLGALALAIIGQRGPGSIVSGAPPPAPTVPGAPANAPLTPPPAQGEKPAQGTTPAPATTPAAPSSTGST